MSVRAGRPAPRWRGHRERLVAAARPAAPVVAVCGGTGCRAQGALGVVDALRAEVAGARSRRRASTCAPPAATASASAARWSSCSPEGIVYQHVAVGDVAEIVERTLLGDEV